MLTFKVGTLHLLRYRAQIDPCAFDPRVFLHQIFEQPLLHPPFASTGSVIRMVELMPGMADYDEALQAFAGKDLLVAHINCDEPSLLVHSLEVVEGLVVLSG